METVVELWLYCRVLLFSFPHGALNVLPGVGGITRFSFGYVFNSQKPPLCWHTFILPLPRGLDCCGRYFSLFVFECSSFQPGHAGFPLLLLSHGALSELTAAFLCIAEFSQVSRRCRVKSGRACGHPECFHASCSPLPLRDEQKPAFFP